MHLSREVWSTYAALKAARGWWWQITISSTQTGLLPVGLYLLHGINISKSQFISTFLFLPFFAPSPFCLYPTSHLPFCLLSLLFHKNVAKMSPHWKPSLAPKIRLVALLSVHIEPGAFPTWHSILITCSFSSFLSRVLILPEQELCLRGETPRVCVHVNWKTFPLQIGISFFLKHMSPVYWASLTW